MTLPADSAATLQRPCADPAGALRTILSGSEKGGLACDSMVNRPCGPALTLQTLSTLRGAR